MSETKTNSFFSELERLLNQKYGADGPHHVKTYLRLTFSKHVTLIEKSLGLKPGCRVLDVGCGTGQFLVEAAVRGYITCGVDTFEEADGIDLKIAQARAYEIGHPVKVVYGNASALPFPSDYFDLVTNFGMLEHIPQHDRSAILQEMFRVVNPGGYLFVIAGPNRNFPYDQHLPGIPFANWLPYSMKVAVAKRYGPRLLLQGPWSVSRTEFKKALPQSQARCLNLYGTFLAVDGGQPLGSFQINPFYFLSYFKRRWQLYRLFGILGYMFSMIRLEHCHILAFQKIAPIVKKNNGHD